MDYQSKFTIGEKVKFIPMFRHTEAIGIESEQMEGTILAVRFTKAKVMYDICDEYHGKIFDNVDSVKVSGIKTETLQES